MVCSVKITFLNFESGVEIECTIKCTLFQLKSTERQNNFFLKIYSFDLNFRRPYQYQHNPVSIHSSEQCCFFSYYMNLRRFLYLSGSYRARTTLYVRFFFLLLIQISSKCCDNTHKLRGCPCMCLQISSEWRVYVLKPVFTLFEVNFINLVMA